MGKRNASATEEARNTSIYRVTTRLAGIVEKYRLVVYNRYNGYSLKRKRREGVDEEIARETERDGKLRDRFHSPVRRLCRYQTRRGNAMWCDGTVKGVKVAWPGSGGQREEFLHRSVRHDRFAIAQRMQRARALTQISMIVGRRLVRACIL